MRLVDYKIMIPFRRIMKYKGSKARLAKELAPIINKLIKDNGISIYIEPFVGGSNMIEHIKCKNKYGYDSNEYLIEFWKHIQTGWNPLSDKSAKMTKEFYYDIKANKDKYPKHIVALAGFCASYNAVWFGGYAGIVKTKIGTFRDYYNEAVRNVIKQAEKIKAVKYGCLDYQQFDIEGALIYCDPPYEGTSKYKDDIDHTAYWEWVRRMSSKNIVLCSEYSAPPDFECIWSKELTTTLDKNSRSKAIERLFVIKNTEKEIKEMELKVNDYQLPETITFNYEELKQELTKKVSMYETLVYTDEQIKEAKTDKVSLNKLKKALNDERIRLEKEYMQPFNDTKAKFNEIIAILDKPVALIDKQVKEYEEKQKEGKLEKIKEYWATVAGLLPVTFEQIFDSKWLNASVSMKFIQGDIDARLEQVKNDLETLQNMPEFGFEATEVYKSTLDINRALNEGRRLSEMVKAKAAHETEQARMREEASKAAIVKPEPAPQPAQEDFMNPPVEEAPAKQWLSFSALLSVEDAQALKQFFNDRNIEFKPM